MANRTGTYVAFDGLGQINPTLSDFKYYSVMQSWHAAKHMEFKYVNSHDKTYAVRDTSQLATLKARIQQRLSASKNVVIILSSETRKSGSMLSFEIEQAVDTWELPLICVYTGYDGIWGTNDISHRWPYSLTRRINNNTARAIHIPFKQAAIMVAIGRFTVNSSELTGSKQYFSREYQVQLGCIKP